MLLLVGAAWFLKWTFDNHWIGPAGRILIGLVAGAAIVVWSERFRKQKMAAFSYALKAVGTGVLYLSFRGPASTFTTWFQQAWRSLRWSL